MYTGKVVGTSIPNSVFEVVFRNDSEFKPNDLPQTNDIVRARENRYIYKDLSVNYKSGHSVRVDQIYLIKSVSQQANAVFVEVIYDP